jgi:hypothetical protein
MSTSTWTGDVSSDWTDPDNWNPTSVPGASSDVMIATGEAVASASIGTVNSITDSSDLSFKSAGTNTVATFLDDTGHLYVDAKKGEGGTILNIGGALTDSGSLRVGGATLSAPDTVSAASLDNTGKIYLTGAGANHALLDVAGSAGFGSAGALSGYVRLERDSAIEFASGEITSLAKSAHLGLNGNDAFIEDSTAQGANSALTGLASIGPGATFTLHDGPAVSTTGALVNDGNIYLDRVDDDGGSSLTVAGALSNGSSVHSTANLIIGNASLSASDTVTAASLDNTGSIQLTGSSADEALLDVNAGSAGFGASGVLSGSVELTGDSAIEFASGQITSLAGYLYLNGNDAFVEDSMALGSNSALTGLASIGVSAGFELNDQAALSTSGALASEGTIEVDALYDHSGGSTLTVAGTLTNDGAGFLGIGNDYLSASDKVMATSLDNTGAISLIGLGANQALLDVTAGSAGFGTAGVLSGNVELTGDSAIEFASGQIASLTGALDLNGNEAFVEDSTALGANSALAGLANVASSLYLNDGAAVSTGGALTNTGSIYLEAGGSLSTTGAVDNSHNIFVDAFSQGGASLSIGGALTNTDNLEIGNGGLSASDSVTAASFVNSGTVDLTGAGANLAALDVSGTTTNNGVISIASDAEALAGAVGGTGSFSLSAANLQFGSSVSAGQTIGETGADALTLNEAQSFAATISGFGTADTIDATDFLKTATTYNFVENLLGTGGTLTLTDTSQSLTANILMTGDYSNSSFTLAPDSGTGTLVKFV